VRHQSSPLVWGSPRMKSRYRSRPIATVGKWDARSILRTGPRLFSAAGAAVWRFGATASSAGADMAATLSRRLRQFTLPRAQRPKLNRGWIGVDLDGTLAEYHGWKGIAHIGAPVPAMVERVRFWLSQGVEVRIFTARVCTWADRRQARRVIGEWCQTHGLPRLAITNTKDYDMIELWDDRAVRVEKNQGRCAGDHSLQHLVHGRAPALEIVRSAENAPYVLANRRVGDRRNRM
jgi:hypothetical protein